MTFSIAARCPETGQFGIAISSSSIAVGARCPWLLPGVGAVSTQNITLPSLGPDVLALMEQGLAPSMHWTKSSRATATANTGKSLRLTTLARPPTSAARKPWATTTPCPANNVWPPATCLRTAR